MRITVTIDRRAAFLAAKESEDFSTKTIELNPESIPYPVRLFVALNADEDMRLCGIAFPSSDEAVILRLLRERALAAPIFKHGGPLLLRAAEAIAGIRSTEGLVSFVYEYAPAFAKLVPGSESPFVTLFRPVMEEGSGQPYFAEAFLNFVRSSDPCRGSHLTQDFPNVGAGLFDRFGGRATPLQLLAMLRFEPFRCPGLLRAIEKAAEAYLALPEAVPSPVSGFEVRALSPGDPADASEPTFPDCTFSIPYFPAHILPAWETRIRAKHYALIAGQSPELKAVREAVTSPTLSVAKAQFEAGAISRAIFEGELDLALEEAEISKAGLSRLTHAHLDSLGFSQVKKLIPDEAFRYFLEFKKKVPAGACVTVFECKGHFLAQAEWPFLGRRRAVAQRFLADERASRALVADLLGLA